MPVSTEDFIVPLSGNLLVSNLDLTVYKSDIPLDPTEYEFITYGAEEYIKTGSSFYLTEENQIKAGSEPETGRSFPVWYFKSKKKYFIIRSTGTQTPEWVWVDLPYVPFYLIKGGRFDGTYVELGTKKYDRYYLDVATRKIFSNNTEDGSTVTEPIWNQDFPETYTQVPRSHFPGPVLVDQDDTRVILPARGLGGIMTMVALDRNFMRGNSVSVDSVAFNEWEWEYLVPPNFTSNFEGLLPSQDIIAGNYDITSLLNNYTEINGSSPYAGRYALSTKQDLTSIAYIRETADNKIYPTLKVRYNAKDLTTGEILERTPDPFHVDGSFRVKTGMESQNKVKYYGWSDATGSTYLYDVSESGWIRFDNFGIVYDGLVSPVSQANADSRGIRSGVNYYLNYNGNTYFQLENSNYKISNEPNQTPKISTTTTRGAWTSLDGTKTLIYDDSTYPDTVTFTSTGLAGDYEIYGSSNYRLEKISWSTKMKLNRAGSYPLWRETTGSHFMIWDNEASVWKRVNIGTSDIFDDNEIGAFDFEAFTNTTNATSNGNNYPSNRGGTLSKYAVAKTPSWVTMNTSTNLSSGQSLSNTQTRLNSTSNSFYPTNLGIVKSETFEILGSDSSLLPGPNYAGTWGYEEAPMLGSVYDDTFTTTAGETISWNSYLPQIYEHEDGNHLIMTKHRELTDGREEVGWVVVPGDDIKENTFTLLNPSTFNDDTETWNFETLPAASNSILYRTTLNIPVSYGGFTENNSPEFQVPDGIPSASNEDTFVDEVLVIGDAGPTEHYPVASNIFFDPVANTYYIHVDDLPTQVERSMIISEFLRTHPNSPYVLVPRGLHLPTYDVQMGRH